MIYIYYDKIAFYELAFEIYNIIINNGIKCKIIHYIDIKTDDLYIMFGMNEYIYDIIPKKYITVQLEQTVGNNLSKWFTPKYISILRNSLYVWEYSLINYRNLKAYDLHNIKYVPIYFLKYYKKSIQEKIVKCDILYDFLFIGTMNDRRHNIIKSLKNKGYRVNTISNIWGDTRLDIINKSNIILNIHYDNESVLETTRLSYLLTLEKIVISEHSNDFILDRFYKDFVIFTKYDDFVDTCVKSINNITSPNFDIFEECCYDIPINDIKNNINDVNSTESPIIDNGVSLIYNNEDLFRPETSIEGTNFLLKLPDIEDEKLPFISVVTITYNRKNIFKLPIFNWVNSTYPLNLREWIVIDDSDDNTDLTDILPINTKYYKTVRMSIADKRNYGVEKTDAKSAYILFMDDDDYYYPCSYISRVKLLLKYEKYDVVGVTDLIIYDVKNDYSCQIKNKPYISEASMAFRKKYWENNKFIDNSVVGEGHLFTIKNRNAVINMPSCFNIIAITHNKNITNDARSMKSYYNRKDNIINTLDINARKLILKIF